MNGSGDIVIPVYLGGTMLDEVIVNAQQRSNLRSGEDDCMAFIQYLNFDGENLPLPDSYEVGFIDANDGMVYQTLPWDHRGWHGGGVSNNTHIGVEMCEPFCITYTGGANFRVADGKLEEARACAKELIMQQWNCLRCCAGSLDLIRWVME